MSKKNVLSVSRLRLSQYRNAWIAYGLCSGISIGLSFAVVMSVYGFTVGVAMLIALLLLFPIAAFGFLAQQYRKRHEWNVREKYR